MCVCVCHSLCYDWWKQTSGQCSLQEANVKSSRDAQGDTEQTDLQVRSSSSWCTEHAQCRCQSGGCEKVSFCSSTDSSSV